MVPFFIYGVLEHDIKGCVTSIGFVDEMKSFRLRSQPRTPFSKATAFAFGAVDPMAALLFSMPQGGWLFFNN